MHYPQLRGTCDTSPAINGHQLLLQQLVAAELPLLQARTGTSTASLLGAMQVHPMQAELYLLSRYCRTVAWLPEAIGQAHSTCLQPFQTSILLLQAKSEVAQAATPEAIRQAQSLVHQLVRPEGFCPFSQECIVLQASLLLKSRQ